MAVQVITLGIDDSEYRRGLRSVDRQFQGFAKTASQAGRTIGTLFGLGGGLALGHRLLSGLTTELQAFNRQAETAVEAFDRLQGRPGPGIAGLSRAQSVYEEAKSSWKFWAGQGVEFLYDQFSFTNRVREQQDGRRLAAKREEATIAAQRMLNEVEADRDVATGAKSAARIAEERRQREFREQLARVQNLEGATFVAPLIARIRVAEQARVAAVAKTLDGGKKGSIFAIASGAGGALIGRQAFGFPGARVSLGGAVPGATSVAAQRAALISEWRTLGVNRPGMTDAELKQHTKRLEEIRETLKQIDRNTKAPARYQ